MSTSSQVKAALVGLLVAAGVIGHLPFASSSAFDRRAGLGLLAFGVVNVLLTARGTQSVRATAIAATLAALLWPSPLLTPVGVLAWLVWPAAFMLAWALAREDSVQREMEGPRGSAAATQARIALAVVVGAVAVASLAYRALVANGLQQTAALFMGIPALLAIVVIFGVSPGTATGVACKAVTIGLLVSLLFLGEGILCVVMSAPLFYGVAIAISCTVDWARRRNARPAPTLFSCVISLALIPMSLEGVTGFTTVSRDEAAVETRLVRGSSQAVERALFEPPRFDRVRPLYLRAGFPSPVSTRIEQSSSGMRWVIQFRGGEMRLDGMEPRIGDLILELEEARPGLVRWRAVSDSSHMTHFLMWREVVVQWEPVDAHTTRVTWTLHYRRGLDPSWYFGPMERYATRLAAGYLIDSVATP
jgi:hypothetical protein